MLRRLAEEKTGCVSIVEECLAAIDAREKDIRAWVVVDRDEARRQAANLDTELSVGHRRGPLHGIPVGVKDIIDVIGLPSVAGYRPWRHRIAGTDAELVRRLRLAGAVILGKTETTQFASYDPSPTRNPHNLDRTPGGSSSGSAAAVAAGMCLVAVGTQTGGSINRPAAFCGVCGFKPSYGAVPLDGVVPVAKSLDHAGPIAGSISDIAYLADVLIDNTDGCFMSNAAAGISQPPRLARLPDLFDVHADRESIAALDRSAEIFERAGASVIDTPLPPILAGIVAAHGLIMDYEAATYHRQRFKEDPAEFQPNITRQINRGLTTSGTDYAAALQVMAEAKHTAAELFANCDAWLAPATVGEAPGLETTGNPVMNSPASFLHLPAINLPVSVSKNGLPLGIQLLGNKNADGELIAIASWAEQQLNDADRS
jgi:Asp-tRNA(Asn)/Glu-tRNA(Gln) amidotransferase A subunit family amidase